MSRILRGIAAAEGVSVGKVCVLKNMAIPTILPPASFEEPERFLAGKKRYAAYLDGLPEGELREVYRELLEDESLEEEVSRQLEKHVSAAAAVRSTLDAAAAEMRELDDAYLQGRADDMEAFRDGLMRAILGFPLEETTFPTEPFFLVGESVSPLDVLNADGRFLRGIVSGDGGKTSHTALLAAGRGLPAVLGVRETDAIQEGTEILVNGTDGTVTLLPTPEEIAAAKMLEETVSDAFLSLPNVTADGRKFSLMANLADPAGIDAVLRFHADGVGLFRTEFLLGKPIPPNEEEQFTIYRTLAEKLDGKPLVVRTFDVGADKPIPTVPLSPEPNPFLGCRGCRVYADFLPLFKTQLRALLRASVFGNIHVMFPMITTVEEVRQLLEWLDETQKELREKGVPFNESLPTGIMIETPAAALIAEELAPLVSFFSIGTNDLTQYTLAADRNLPAVSSLYAMPHPAVFTLIRQSIAAAHRFGKSVGMCGEWASRPELAATFFNDGLDVWSVNPAQIPAVKTALRACYR